MISCQGFLEISHNYHILRETTNILYVRSIANLLSLIMTVFMEVSLHRQLNDMERSMTI